MATLLYEPKERSSHRSSLVRFSYPWVLIALVLLASVVASCTRVSKRFEDASVAEKEGFFQQGWLPNVLPEEAGPIVGIYDLDTNDHCSRVDLTAGSLSRVESALREKGFGIYSGALPKPPFKSCPFSLEVAQKADIALRRMSLRETEFAALDSTSDVLLFWAIGPE